MICQRCYSNRVLKLIAHHKDQLTEVFQGNVYEGYSMTFPGAHNGNDTELDICLNCGQVQGTFPRLWPPELPLE